MSFDRKKSGTLELVWRYAAAAAFLWTTLAVVSLAVSYRFSLAHHTEMLEDEANANFNIDRAFRNWNTRHGGAYVPVSESTSPNPYLAHIPERDITTPRERN